MGRRNAGTAGNDELIGNGNWNPDVIGFSHDGIPVLGGQDREAIFSVFDDVGIRFDFRSSSTIWNKDFWASDDGFLFRILEKWVLIRPTKKPVEKQVLSNHEAWKWFESNAIDPPLTLREWHGRLLQGDQFGGAVMGSDPPWGSLLRVLIDKHFPKECTARFVGLGISQGETSDEIKEFLQKLADEATHRMLLDMDDSGRKKYLREKLSSAIAQLKAKLRIEGFNLSYVGDRYELTRVESKPIKNKPKR